MSADPVLALLADHREVVEFLRNAGQLSFVLRVERNMVKVFVLSGASYFEHRIVNAITSLAQSVGDERLAVLVRNKAVKRQYHTFFNWDDRKLGPFLTMFGDGFADSIKRLKKDDPGFEKTIQSFLELGATRNEIVHKNFSVFDLPGTVDEWVERYRDAGRFVEFVESALAPASLVSSSVVVGTVATVVAENLAGFPEARRSENDQVRAPISGASKAEPLPREEPS